MCCLPRTRISGIDRILPDARFPLWCWSIVVLGNSQWPVVRLHLDIIAATVDVAAPGSYAEVDIPFE
jgi:hypothetical protein